MNTTEINNHVKIEDNMTELAQYIFDEVNNLEEGLDHTKATIWDPELPPYNWNRGRYTFDYSDLARMKVGRSNYLKMMDIIKKQKQLISLLIEESKNKSKTNDIDIISLLTEQLKNNN